MNTGFLVNTRDNKPYLAVVATEKGTRFRPLVPAAKNIAKMFADEYSKSGISKNELAAALDRGMTIEGPMPVSQLPKTIKKFQNAPSVDAPATNGKPYTKAAIDAPISSFDRSDFAATIAYKAAAFEYGQNKTTFNYEVKRIRAVWDPSLAIPGTRRIGGWRCPEGTDFGGQITDEFGRNCGWGIARRIANAITSVGDAIGQVDPRATDRRLNRAARREERRQRAENMARQREEAARAEQVAQTVGAQDNPAAGQVPQVDTEATTERTPGLADEAETVRQLATQRTQEPLVEEETAPAPEATETVTPLEAPRRRGEAREQRQQVEETVTAEPVTDAARRIAASEALAEESAQRRPTAEDEPMPGEPLPQPDSREVTVTAQGVEQRKPVPNMPSSYEAKTSDQYVANLRLWLEKAGAPSETIERIMSGVDADLTSDRTQEAFRTARMAAYEASMAGAEMIERLGIEQVVADGLTAEDLMSYTGARPAWLASRIGQARRDMVLDSSKAETLARMDEPDWAEIEDRVRSIAVAHAALLEAQAQLNTINRRLEELNDLIRAEQARALTERGLTKPRPIESVSADKLPGFERPKLRETLMEQFAPNMDSVRQAIDEANPDETVATMVDTALSAIDPLVSQAVFEAEARIDRMLTAVVENLSQRMDDPDLSDADILAAIERAMDVAGVAKRGRYQGVMTLDDISTKINNNLAEIVDGLQRGASTSDIESLRDRLEYDLAPSVRHFTYDEVQKDDSQYLIQQVRNGLTRLRAERDNPDDQSIQEMLQARQVLDKGAVKRVRDWVKAAIGRRRSALGQYLLTRHPENRPLPWASMTPENYVGLMKAQKEAFFENLYSHDIIKGTNGKYYSVKPYDVTVYEYANSSDSVRVNATIYEVDENGTAIRTVGYAERKIDIEFARDADGNAVRVRNGYVENERFFVNSRADQNSGIATILNGYAFMGLNSIGVNEARVGAAAQGQFVWARMGFGSDFQISSSDRGTLRSALRFYEIFGTGGIIRDDEDYRRIAGLIADDAIAVSKQDVIFALIGEQNGGRDLRREQQVAGFMLTGMPFTSGSRDLTNEEYQGDPRLEVAQRLVEAEEMKKQVEQLRDEGAPQDLIDAATPPDLVDERWINDVDGRIQGVARAGMPKEIVQALDNIIKSFPYDTDGMPQVVADIEATSSVLAMSQSLAQEVYAETIENIRNLFLNGPLLNLYADNRQELEQAVLDVLSGDPEGLLDYLASRNQSDAEALEEIIQGTDARVETAIDAARERLETALQDVQAGNISMRDLTYRIRSAVATDEFRIALRRLHSRKITKLADMQRILREAFTAEDGSLIRQKDAPERPEGLPASTVRKVKQIIKDAIKGRKRKLANYLVSRFGDEPLPWDGMTRARFDAMSLDDKKNFLAGLYTHPRIEGTNGRLYTVEARAGHSYTGDWSVAGNIYEIDENGNKLRTVGEFSRTLKFSAASPHVKNDSFFIGGSVADKNNGLATILNSYAFTGLQTLGFNRATVRTASDGPFVWARLGFRQTGGISEPTRWRLDGELKRYENFRSTPIGIIQTPEQYFALKDLLAQRTRTGALTKVHHQEVIFALLGENPTKQRNTDVYRFMLRSGITSGTLTFSREGIEADPRGVLREDATERRGRRRRGEGDEAPPVREKPKPLAQSGPDAEDTPEKSIAMQEEELAEAPALTDEGLEWRADLRMRLRQAAERHGLDYDKTFRMVLDLLPADYSEAPLQVRMAMDVLNRLPDRLDESARKQTNERAGTIARTILDGVFADDGTPIRITPESTDEEIDQFVRKALLLDDPDDLAGLRDDHLDQFRRGLRGASPIPVLSTPGEPWATGDVADTITAILGPAMNGVDYGAVSHLVSAFLYSADADIAADPSRWRAAVRRGLTRLQTVPRNEAGQITPPQIVPFDVNSVEGDEAVAKMRSWARSIGQRRTRTLYDYIFDRHQDTGILPWEGMSPAIYMALSPEQRRDYLRGLYQHERIVGNDGRIYYTSEVRVTPAGGVDADSGIGYKGDAIQGKILELMPDGQSRFVGEFRRYVNFPEEVWGSPLRISQTYAPHRPFVLQHSLIISDPADRNNGVATVLNGYAFEGLLHIGVQTARITGTVQDGPYVWARTGFDSERGIQDSRQIAKITEELAIFEAFGPGHGMGVIQTSEQYEAVRMLVAEYDMRRQRSANTYDLQNPNQTSNTERQYQIDEMTKGISRQDLIYSMLLGNPGSGDGRELNESDAQAVADALAHERRVKTWIVGNVPLREGTLRFGRSRLRKFDDLRRTAVVSVSADRDVAAVAAARSERVGAREKVDQIRAIIKTTVETRTNRIADYIARRARAYGERYAERLRDGGEEITPEQFASDIDAVMRETVPWDRMTPERFEALSEDDRLSYLRSLIEHPQEMSGREGWFVTGADAEEDYTPYQGWRYSLRGRIVDANTGESGDFQYTVQKTTDGITFYGDRLFLPDSLKRMGVGTSFAGFVQEGIRAIGATTSRVPEQAQDGLHVWFRMGFNPEEGANFQESIPEFADDLRALLVPGNPEGEELLPTEPQRQALLAILNNPNSTIQDVLFGLMKVNDDGTIDRDNYEKVAKFVGNSLNEHRADTEILMDTSGIPVLYFDEAMERAGGAPKIDFPEIVPPVDPVDNEPILPQPEDISEPRALENTRHSMVRERIRQAVQRRRNRIAEAVVARIERDGRTPWEGMTTERYFAMSEDEQKAFIASLFTHTADTTGGRWETRIDSVSVTRNGRQASVNGAIVDLRFPEQQPTGFVRSMFIPETPSDIQRLQNYSLIVPETLQREGVATIINGFAQHGLRELGVRTTYVSDFMYDAIPRWLQHGYEPYSRDLVTGFGDKPLTLDQATPLMRDAIRDLLYGGSEKATSWREKILKNPDVVTTLEEIIDNPDLTLQELMFALDDPSLVGDEKKQRGRSLGTWFAEQHVFDRFGEQRPLVLPYVFDSQPQTAEEWREAAESTRIAFGPDHAAAVRPRPIQIVETEERPAASLTEGGRVAERGRLEGLLRKLSDENGVDYSTIIYPILDALPDDVAIESLDLGEFVRAVAGEIKNTGPAAADQVESELRKMIGRLVNLNPTIDSMTDREIVSFLVDSGVIDSGEERRDAIEAMGRRIRTAIGVTGRIAPLPTSTGGRPESDVFGDARIDGGPTNREILADMTDSVLPYIERGARLTALANMTDEALVMMVRDAIAVRDDQMRNGARRAMRIVGNDRIEVNRNTRQKIAEAISERDLREMSAVDAYRLRRFENEGEFPWDNLGVDVSEMTDDMIADLVRQAYQHDEIAIGDWTYRTRELRVRVKPWPGGARQVEVSFRIEGVNNVRDPLTGEWAKSSATWTPVSEGKVDRDIVIPGAGIGSGQVQHSVLSLRPQFRNRGIATIINGYSYDVLRRLNVDSAIVGSAVTDGPYVWSRIGFTQELDSWTIDALESELERWESGASDLIDTQQQADMVGWIVAQPEGTLTTQDFVFALQLANTDSDAVRGWMEDNFTWGEGVRYLGDNQPETYREISERVKSGGVSPVGDAASIAAARVAAAEAAEAANAARIAAQEARQREINEMLIAEINRGVGGHPYRNSIVVMPPALKDILDGAQADLSDLLEKSPEVATSVGVHDAGRAMNAELLQSQIELGVIATDQAIETIMRMAFDQILDSDAIKPLPTSSNPVPPREVVLNIVRGVLRGVIDGSDLGKMAKDAAEDTFARRTFDQIALRLKSILDDLHDGKLKGGESADRIQEIGELARAYGSGIAMKAFDDPYTFTRIVHAVGDGLMKALRARADKGEESGDGGAFVRMPGRGYVSLGQAENATREKIRGYIEPTLSRRLGIADAHMRRRFPNGTPWDGMTPRKFAAMKKNPKDREQFLQDIYDTGVILAPNGQKYRVVPYQITPQGNDTFEVLLDIQLLNDDNSLQQSIGYGTRNISLAGGVVFNNEFIIYDESHKSQNLATISNHIAFSGLRTIGVTRARLNPIADGSFVWAYMGFGPKPGEGSFTPDEIRMLRDRLIGNSDRFDGTSLVRSEEDRRLITDVLELPNLTHQELIFALMADAIRFVRESGQYDEESGEAPGQDSNKDRTVRLAQRALEIRKRQVKAWITANVPAKGTMHLSFDDMFGPIEFDDDEVEPTAWQPPEEGPATPRRMSRPGQSEGGESASRPGRTSGGTRTTRRMTRRPQQEQEPVEPRTPVAGARILQGEQRKPALGKTGSDGLPAIASVPSGNMGIKSVDDAVAYMSGDGVLSEVPDELLVGVITSMPQRFEVVRPGGSGINEDETRFVTDKVTGAKYIYKYVAGSRRSGEEMHEILGNNLLARFGFPVAGYRYAGPEYTNSPTDGGDVPARPILFEHVDNFIGNAEYRRPPYSQDWENIPLSDLVRMTLLDYVMMNQDRHSGNFWVVPDGTGNMRLVPFDHGHAFQSRGGPNLDAMSSITNEYSKHLADEYGVMKWAGDKYGGLHNQALAQIAQRLQRAETADEILQIVRELRKELLDSEAAKSFLQFAGEMRESAGYDNPRVNQRAIRLTGMRLEWLLSQDPVFIRDLFPKMIEAMEAERKRQSVI